MAMDGRGRFPGAFRSDPATSFLFVRPSGSPVPAAREGHTTTVGELFRQVVGDAGLDSDQVACHTLRHPRLLT